MDGLLFGLAEGIKSGVESYQNAKKTRDAQELELQKMQQQKEQQDRAFGLEQEKFGYEKKKGLLSEQTKLREKNLDADLDYEAYELKNLRPLPRGLIKQKEKDPLAEELKEARLEAMRREERQDLAARDVPGVGTALTPTDANELKTARASKESFDSNVKEMIALRKKHNGGSIWNREDVERAKQLSKTALLEYKNMAKLGVLSGSDTDIINSIIPEDPLQYSGAGLLGQDPISHRLKSFLKDNDKIYNEKIKAKLNPAAQPKALAAEGASLQELLAEKERRKMGKNVGSQ